MIKFHTENPHILGATIQNLVAGATWCQGFVQTRSQGCTSGFNIWMQQPRIC